MVSVTGGRACAAKETAGCVPMANPRVAVEDAVPADRVACRLDTTRIHATELEGGEGGAGAGR